MSTGGATQQAALLAKEQTALGHQHVLISGSIGPDEGDMTHLLDDASGSVILVSSMGREVRPLSDIRTVWEIVRLLRQVKPDVVHTHAAKAGVVGRIAAFLARTPVVIHTYHGHVLRGYFGPMKSKFYLTVERLLARVTTVIVTLSPTLVEELSGAFKIGKLEQYEVC